MKKLLICLLAVIGFIATANAQTVVVQNNQGGATEQMQDPNIFYINGIPSTQDIGGVEALPKYYSSQAYAVFTNYHSLPVTVLYRVIYSGQYQKIGSLVLNSKETKEVYIAHCPTIYEIATITRKL